MELCYKIHIRFMISRSFGSSLAYSRNVVIILSSLCSSSLVVRAIGAKAVRRSQTTNPTRGNMPANIKPKSHDRNPRNPSKRLFISSNRFSNAPQAGSIPSSTQIRRSSTLGLVCAHTAALIKSVSPIAPNSIASVLMCYSPCVRGFGFGFCCEGASTPEPGEEGFIFMPRDCNKLLVLLRTSRNSNRRHRVASALFYRIVERKSRPFGLLTCRLVEQQPVAVRSVRL